MTTLRTNHFQQLKVTDEYRGTANRVQQFAFMLSDADLPTSTTTIGRVPVQVEWVFMDITFTLTLVTEETLDASVMGHPLLRNVEWDDDYCRALIHLEQHRVRNRIELPQILMHMDSSDESLPSEALYKTARVIASQFGGTVPARPLSSFSVNVLDELAVPHQHSSCDTLRQRLAMCLLG